MASTHLPSSDSILEDGGETGGRLLPYTSPAEARPALRGAVAFLCVVFLRWWRLGWGLLRALLRLSGLSLVFALALADAALARLTTNPAAGPLARGRAAWFQRWSRVACSVLGLQIERRGFAPVSGIVIVNKLSLIDVILLSSVAPFVFVGDMDVRRRTIVGWVARLAGTLFRDRQRRSDVSRINFMIERALRRRQLVVIFRTCEWFRQPALIRFPSALLQPAADSRCSLTAAAIHYKSRGAVERTKRSEFRSTTSEILMQPLSLVTIAFHPPAFHNGDRKQLFKQLWREVQTLEEMETSHFRCRGCDRELWF